MESLYPCSLTPDGTPPPLKKGRWKGNRAECKACVEVILNDDILIIEIKFSLDIKFLFEPPEVREVALVMVS